MKIVRLEKSNYLKTLVGTAAFAIVLLTLGGITQSLSFIQPAFASSSSTGILDPLYIYPNQTSCSSYPNDFCWQPIITAKQNHPKVPIFVIVNPNGGPGSYNSDYAYGISKLQQAGIVVLGYVYTNYGARSLTGTGSVESDISGWKSVYPSINGIFFDEMDYSDTNKVTYYQQATAFAKSQNFALNYTIGNPGVNTYQDYRGSVDNLLIHEQTNYPDNATLQGGGTTGPGTPAYWNVHYPKTNFSFMVCTQATGPTSSWIQSMSPYVGYMFISNSSVDANGNCQWDTMPSYLDNEIAALDKSSAILTINSTNLAGTPITNYYIQFNQSGNVVPSGSTPLTFNSTSGWKYLVTPISSGDCTFAYWKDLGSGSTVTSRYMTINSTNPGFTAVYKNTNSSVTCGGSTTSPVVNNVKSTSGTIVLPPDQLTLSSFNAGTGSNRLLVVGVEADDASATSVTFGGTALTQAVSTFTNEDSEFWYLKNPTGAGNIVVTMSGPTSVVVGAYAISGVDQTNPIPTTATNSNSGNPTVSITTKYSNSLAVDSASIYGQSTLSSPTCTQGWDVNIPNLITGASSYTVKSSPGSVTCSWTSSVGGNGWDDAAIEVKASS